MKEFWFKFNCKDNCEYSIVIEDDKKVAYAYLFKGDDIVGDIWLYNHIPTPLSSTWKRKDIPFLNPLEFVKRNIEPIRDANEISLQWVLKKDLEFDYLLITIRNELIVKLSEGSTPGWSTCVEKDGPLAKVLDPL